MGLNKTQTNKTNRKTNPENQFLYKSKNTQNTFECKEITIIANDEIRTIM